jgi:hypothetical protein
LGWCSRRASTRSAACQAPSWDAGDPGASSEVLLLYPGTQYHLRGILLVECRMKYGPYFTSVVTTRNVLV